MKLGVINFVFGRSNSDSDEFLGGPILAGITTLFLYCICSGWRYNYDYIAIWEG